MKTFKILKSTKKSATHTTETGDYIILLEVKPFSKNITNTFECETWLEAETRFGLTKYVHPIIPNLPPIPSTIQNWRAKAILSLNGLLLSVQEAIEALPDPQKTIVKTAWEGNADLARNGETVTAIAAACNLSDEQIDNLFIEAAKLRI